MGNEHYYHTFLKVVILAVLLVFSIVSLAVFVKVSRSLASLVRSYRGGVGVTVALASAMISHYVLGNVFYYSCTILATKRRFSLDLTSRWRVRFRQTCFSKRSPKGALQASVGLRSN